MKIQLTLNQIEMFRNGLLASDWCGFSKRETVNAICDHATAAIELQEKIAAAGELPEAKPYGDSGDRRGMIQMWGGMYVLRQDYDTLRALATAQAVRIAEFDEAAIYEKCALICDVLACPDSVDELRDGAWRCAPGYDYFRQAGESIRKAAKHD